MDFRAVQGAVATDVLSNLLFGLAGTMPNTSYSTGASIARLTGVASRNVGIAVGALFLALAFFPKALALVLGIPGPDLCDLSHRDDGHAVHGRQTDNHPGPDQLPQGPDRRRQFHGGNRLSSYNRKWCMA